MKRILFSLFFLVLLSSCSEEFKPATFETTSIKNSYKADISFVGEKAVGDNELSKRINFNIEKAVIANLSIPDKKTNLEMVLKDFNSEYLSFKKKFRDESELPWELHIETEKTYQSEDIITIAISIYEFKGGAHGNDKISFLNLDAKTGNILEHSDFIEKDAAFKKIANSYFLTEVKNKKANQSTESYFFGKPFQLPENIGFSDDGLILLYNTYEIAAYEQGYIEFAIPLEEAKPFLKLY